MSAVTEEMQRLIASFAEGSKIERERCLAVIDDVIAAAKARRKDHHALPWLNAVRAAIESGAEDGVLHADSCDGGQ